MAVEKMFRSSHGLSSAVSRVSQLRYQSTSKTFAYTLDRVKKFDNENYWATIRMKNANLVRHVIALRAFNVELAQIADVTTAESAATGRLDFWTGIINLLYDEKQSHTKNAYIASNPVILELLTSIENCERKLPKYLFSKLIKSRSLTLKPFPFETTAELEQYADSSLCPIYLLTIRSVPFVSDKQINLTDVETTLDHISGHLSKAIVITSVLRGLRHNAARNRCYVPLENLVKYKISQQELLRCQPNEKVRDMFFDLACLAKSHLDKSKKLLKDSQVHRFTDIFLPLIFCDIYLTRLEKENFNIFSEKLINNSPLLPYHFFYRSLRLSYLHY